MWALSTISNLTVPIEINAEEDGGVINSAAGVRVPLQIAIAITDDDGSETEATGSPFSAEVTIDFTDLPAGATLTTGVLTGTVWTGSVADARALAIDFPGNYAGIVLANITVTTLEGSRSAPQAIVVTPTPDVNITGTITATETDAPVTVLLSDFISLTITDPSEELRTLSFDLPGLPAGTLALDASGAPIGTLTPGAGGTLTFAFSYNALTDLTVDPSQIRLVFPTDFSTTSPANLLQATLTVVSVQSPFPPNPPVFATIDVEIDFEGDVRIDVVGTATLQETDAVVDFAPSDYLTPVPTDIDGSETIDQVNVTFNALPAGTLFSTDGVSFSAASAALNFVGTLAEYNALIIRLPADFATENPASTLVGTVIATTNELGVATETFAVTVSAEGDVTASGPRTLSLGENDAPGSVDLDATTQAPLQFFLASAVTAVASDADGSDEIVSVAVAMTGLPAGSQISFDNGVSFVAVDGATFPLTVPSLSAYERIVLRLPDDFSTTSPASTIAGTVTFTTNEALLNGETAATPNGGITTEGFTVTVTAEGDVSITGLSPVVIEDLGAPIDLGLAVAVTDTDGSESISTISVTFAGLPGSGPTILSDGTVLTPSANVWTGSSAAIANLAIASFPQHFSGIVTMTTTVVTNETLPGGESAVFVLSVTPVAEPDITLSVVPNAPTVTQTGPGIFSVKEDNSFLLQIDATTPDKDGSETLRTISIANMPSGWLRAGDGAVPLSRFETGSADIASATVTGTTLTITLQPGVTDFNATLRAIPAANSDLDVSTLTGGDLRATVTSVDTATGLASNTQTAQATVDVNYDAVLDPLTFATTNRAANENLTGRRGLDAGITSFALRDTDGSELLDSVTLRITVDTKSTDFDPANDSDLRLTFGSRASFVSVTKIDTVADDNIVDFVISRPAGVSDANFASALVQMQVSFPQRYSGVATLDGVVNWSETRTGDVETDLGDNNGSRPFTTVLTVRPISEATLDAGLFVTDGNFVVAGSPTQATAVAIATTGNVSTSNSTPINLLESTADSTGPGQVQTFLRLNASTPDADGSENLSTLVISNIPTSWIGIAETNGNVTLTQSHFFSLSGGGPISAAEFAKVSSAVYNAATGQLTITFVTPPAGAPGITSFAGSVALYPALYEDYDVDRRNTDPFSADGNFFGADLGFRLTTSDGNTVTTGTRQANVTVNVDVKPVNNEGKVIAFPIGNEQVVDDAGGVLQFGFVPFIDDMDGSETIISTVLRNIPSGITVYVPSLSDPAGPKVPALLTSLNGDGTNDWSLEGGQWLNVEFRGVPLHFAGSIPIIVDIVTREADGGGTGKTSLMNVNIEVDPVVDGGDPSESAATVEDTAVRVVLDGNIIDNATNSPLSPEVILDPFTITNVRADSFGRLPRFFDGPPNQIGTDSAGNPIYSNEILPLFDGSYVVTPAQAADFHVLPGKDSNSSGLSGVADIQFDVRVIYRELLDVSASTPLDRFKVGTGTVRIDITGIADKPVVDGQDPDPAATAGGIDKTLINAVYRPGDTTDGVPNEDAAYAYAGFDNAPFQFLQRLSDTALQSGFAGDPAPFVAADPLSGSRTEITFAGGLPDGSETIYYVISNIPAGLRFIGGNPVDPSAGSYLVAGSKLASLGIVPQGVSDVTYYNMTLNAIVVEDDADLSGVPTAGGSVSVQDVLDAIDALPGGSVTPFDLSVVVLPSGTVGPPMSCMPGDPEYLPLPELRLVGNAFEDQPNELKIQLVPDAPVGGNPNYWNSIGDLTTLPNGVSGDFGLGIKIPPGATLSANPPGAVLFDPVTGTYSIDFSLLGVDPSDPTLTAGAIIYTPPPQQSSPVNPFPAGETLGSADPYDNLPDIEFTSLLNNYTCNLFFNQTTIVPVFVQPVVDGPTIDIGATGPFLEDTLLTPDIRISSVDGGERLTGDVVLTISGDPTASLLLSGVPLSPDAGTTARYTLAATDLPGLQVLPTRDYSGPLTLTVTASTEDIDGAIAAGTASRTFAIEAVAEVPDFVYSTDTTPTETGLPLVQDPTGPLPIVTLIEDRPALLSSFFNFGDSLDRDGSEAESAVVGPLPDYLELTGATRGIIDNGDGTFTVSRADFGTVMIGLKDAHARTPDSLDPTILAEVSINVRVNTLELSNSDEATASTQFLLRVFPDADKPTVTASISPLAGTEDDGTIYTLTVSGNTIDPHERIDFEATLPPGSRFFIGGVEQVVGADGKVAIPGAAAGIAAPGSNVFFPIGALTFIPPADFSGLAAVEVVAITSDTSAAYGFTDTARSDPATTSVTIAAAPDLAVTVTDPTMTIAETDAPVAFMPASNVTLAVSDADGSEIVEIVTFTMTGVPDGTTVDTGSGAVPTSGTLSFTGTLAEFNALTITFPRDFATNATPLAATVQATTNEGGNQSGSFTLAIDGELDLDLSTAPVRLAGAAPADLVVPLGITADVTDVQASPSETLESVVVAFGTALPAGVTASAGVIASDRLSLSLTRGAMLPADFALMVAALSLTVPAAAAATTVFDGTVTATTNHGTSAPVALDIAVNAPPVVTAPVDVPQTFDTTLSLSFADLLVNASDSDLPLTVENVTASDPLVGVSVSGTDVTLTVPAGYVGTPTLSYDVVDGGAVPARTVATAELDFDTLQMQDSGIDVTGPDSLSRNLLTDVSGDASLGGTIATGTAGNDAVIWDAVDRPYAGITEFRMLDGDDFVDLTGAPGGFRVELGAGADIVIGSGGNDVLIGGSGADSLTGGAGADTFVLASGPIDIADVITDFGAGDQIDLRSALNGIDDITGLASFNAATGALDVGGLTAFNVAAAGGGIPAQVQVIFEDSAGAAQTAVL